MAARVLLAPPNLPESSITASTHALGACSPGSIPGSPTEKFSGVKEDLVRVQISAPRQQKDGRVKEYVAWVPRLR